MGATGAQDIQGERGQKGDTGDDGISCAHSWNGTVLSVTGASGASSADLVGPQGPKGDTGATGPAGADGASGTTFTLVEPLSLDDGELSVDLSGLITSGINVMEVGQNDTRTFSGYYGGNMVGELLYSTRSDSVSKVTAIDEIQHKVTVKGIVELSRLRGLIETTLDVAPGSTGSNYTKVGGNALKAGTLLLNVTSGNLMCVTTDVTRPSISTGTMNVSVEGVGNVYGGVSSLMTQSPLDITNNVISIDLSDYAETDDLPPAVVVRPLDGGRKGGQRELLLQRGLQGRPARRPAAQHAEWRPFSMRLLERYRRDELHGYSAAGEVPGHRDHHEPELAAGATGSGAVDCLGHSVCTGTLILNTTTGALMWATSTADPASASATTVTVSAIGLGNVFAGPDLLAYATKQYVDDAIAALDDLSEESF